MSSKRIKTHPIINITDRIKVNFSWNGTILTGFQNETIASSLFANGIHVFGHHHKDNSPQGIFCANGQCSQCMVMVNNVAVKACMTKIKNNLKIQAMEGIPTLKNIDTIPIYPDPKKKYNVSALIIGGGPAGLSAAIELGKLNINTILLDDKDRLGGKLLLQTHKFFGSVKDSYAGTRGFEIASVLDKKLREYKSIDIWTNSTAVGTFSDGIIGVFRKGTSYEEIIPEKLLIATGAREQMLSFPGNTLPGIYGAGAFQTLVNRDLVKASERILIIGGGNVGLIAGYHAIQAGIEVIGLIEALPETGGYKVHSDKLLRMGVPIFTSHTVIAAHGKNHVHAVTIAEIDKNWNIKSNTYKTFNVDTILIAVGLAKVNEFYLKAKQWTMDAYTAGDAHEIAEASAAMLTGKIEGLKIAKSIGAYRKEIPVKWNEKAIILKLKPGKPIKRKVTNKESGVFPVFHCFQEIPCNPCTSVCPKGAIQTLENKIQGLPYLDKTDVCKGCMACLAICPGLAITLVDYRKNTNNPIVTIPYEMSRNTINKGNKIEVINNKGISLGKYEVINVISNKKKYHGTLLIQVQIQNKFAKEVSGIKLQKIEYHPSTIYEKAPIPDEAIVCRCERVSAVEIRNAILDGVTDFNHMKAVNRVGMGSCGSKTCRPMVWRILKEEGVDLSKVTDRVDRPLFVEVPMWALAGLRREDNDA